MSNAASDVGQKLEKIRTEAAEVMRELRGAIAAYCLFKAAAVDAALLERVGFTGRASLAFQFARESHHRDCVMALMRIWDKDKRALSLDKLLGKLKDRGLADELKRQRLAERMSDYEGYRVLDREKHTAAELVEIDRILKDDSAKRAKQAADRVDGEVRECLRLAKQAAEGPIAEAKALLRSLRDQRLAHVEISPPPDRPPPSRLVQIGDERILLNLTITIVEKLSGLLDDAEVDLRSLERQWRRNAAALWHSVKSETASDIYEIEEAVSRVYGTGEEE